MIIKTQCGVNDNGVHGFYVVQIENTLKNHPGTSMSKHMEIILDHSHYSDGLYIRVMDATATNSVRVHASLDEAEELALVILAKVKERRENGIH